MPNYAKAKIYQVISPNHPVPYIGSTTQTLSARMRAHRAEHICSSRVVIDAGDAYIELIEEFPCENKEQLNKREGEIIRQRECVNHRVAGRTDKEWREDNSDRVKAYHIQNYQKNREAKLAYQKAYRARRKAEASVDVLLQQTGKTD